MSAAHPPDSGSSPSQSERLALVIATQREIAAAADADEHAIFDLICERAMALTDAGGAMISLVDGDELVVHAALGLTAPAMGVRRTLSESVARHAFEARETLLIEDTEGDPRINRKLNRKVGGRSLICVPLLKGDVRVAAINIVRGDDAPRFGPAEVETLELLAVVLSAVVSRVAEEQARSAQRDALVWLEAIYTSAQVGIVTLGPDGIVLGANPAMEAILGFDEQALCGRRLLALVEDDDVEAVQQARARAADPSSGTLRLEHRFRRADGGIVWVDSTAATIRDAAGTHQFTIVTLLDITQGKAAEEALREQAETNGYLALHDVLTGLANRALFADRAAQALEAARRSGHELAVLIMDLDSFKQVNDTLGHSAGDEVLIEVGRRLSSVLRASDTAARMGGDEFAILLPDLSDRAEVGRIIERVYTALDAPLLVAGNVVRIAASTGIATFPTDGADTQALVAAADHAMYDAKRGGRQFSFVRGAA